MEKRYYSALQETAWWGKLPNGLTLAVIPRPGYSKYYAYYTTAFGSIHRRFTLDGKEYTVPRGIAHFLEHKLFDMPDGRDVSEEFAALGAYPNAFTSYDMTAYYFKSSGNFDACLRLLLEFVSTPYFTEETVEKEQGIIGQEIDRNADDPDSRLNNLLMEAMYRQHPAREEILGSRESIGRITPEMLHLCHKAFYHPSNMILCVVGDVDPEQVEALAREVLPDTPAPDVTCVRHWPEEMTCAKEQVRADADVSRRTFSLGFKAEPVARGFAGICEDQIAFAAASLLYGSNSDFFLRLYNEGLLDGTFGIGSDTMEDLAMLVFSGESDDPERVREEILKEARRFLAEGADETALQGIKRAGIGRRIRGLDNFDSVCFNICAYYLSGFDYFEIPAVYPAVTMDAIRQYVERVLTPSRACLAIIDPTEEVTQ